MNCSALFHFNRDYSEACRRTYEKVYGGLVSEWRSTSHFFGDYFRLLAVLSQSLYVVNYIIAYTGSDKDQVVLNDIETDTDPRFCSGRSSFGIDQEEEGIWVSLRNRRLPLSGLRIIIHHLPKRETAAVTFVFFLHRILPNIFADIYTIVKEHL